MPINHIVDMSLVDFFSIFFIVLHSPVASLKPLHECALFDSYSEPLPSGQPTRDFSRMEVRKHVQDSSRRVPSNRTVSYFQRSISMHADEVKTDLVCPDSFCFASLELKVSLVSCSMNTRRVLGDTVPI